MKYVDIFGNKVSRLGLGSPRPFRHGADDHSAEYLIRKAFDLGVNFFDTAPAYGSEHNLRVLPRGEVFLSTKSPHRMSIRQGWRKVPEKLQSTLENSLRLMKTDYVDFYFLHAVTLNVFNKLTPEILETLSRFKEQGKIEYIGVSEDVPHDPGRKMAATACRHEIIDLMMIHHPFIAKISKPAVGMLVGGPVTADCLKRFDITLTGTSNIEHLKQNVKAYETEVTTKEGST